MTSKELLRRVARIYDSTLIAYYSSLDPNSTISKIERKQIQALTQHAKAVYETLKELPF